MKGSVSSGESIEVLGTETHLCAARSLRASLSLTVPLAPRWSGARRSATGPSAGTASVPCSTCPLWRPSSPTTSRPAIQVPLTRRSPTQRVARGPSTSRHQPTRAGEAEEGSSAPLRQQTDASCCIGRKLVLCWCHSPPQATHSDEDGVGSVPPTALPAEGPRIPRGLLGGKCQSFFSETIVVKASLTYELDPSHLLTSLDGSKTSLDDHSDATSYGSSSLHQL